ncbi:MAG: hypothetical protein HRK26_04930 [Rickettsiaceae bacterium H1]|nr:hypothetical protein [Rickettsiaceae bacterium H1]
MEAVKKLGSKIGKEWNKSWSERSRVSNATLALPKLAVSVISFAGTPFPKIRRKINQEIDREGRVHVSKLITPLFFEGRQCKSLSKDEIKNANIDKTKDTHYKYSFTYKGTAHKLSEVTNAQGKVITKDNGDKLYYVEGLDKEERYNPVVWISSNGELRKDHCNEIVKQQIESNIKAITTIAYSESTGSISIFSIITYPIGIIAIICKTAGAIIKVALDIPGNILCSLQDRLLQGLDLKYTAQENNSIEYGDQYTKSLTQMDTAKNWLGNSLGIIGNLFKLIGTVINETLRLSSAVISSPSAICGPTFRETKKEHVIASGKSFADNIKDSIVELANSAIKNPKNIERKFFSSVDSETDSKKNEKNTVAYGHDKELSQKKQNMMKDSLSLGKNLLGMGVKVKSENDLVTQALKFAQQHDNQRSSTREA